MSGRIDADENGPVRCAFIDGPLWSAVPQMATVTGLSIAAVSELVESHIERGVE